MQVAAVSGPRPLPVPSVLSEPFWSATSQGRLVLQRCAEGGHWQWTPQLACTTCLSENLDWTDVCGDGVLYSFSVVTRPQVPSLPVPYVVAIVELAEGPRILTELVDVQIPKIRIGMSVRVRFESFGDLALYRFAPREGS